MNRVTSAVSTSRGVAAGRSAQRGTSGATTGGGGRSAPDPYAYKAERLSLGMKLGELRLGYFGRQFAHDDHGQDLVGCHVGFVDGADQSAVEHHADAVGQVEDVMDVVADEEDADSLSFELLDQGPNLGRFGGSERGCRLVHDQDPRVEVDRARNCHRLTLTAGE